MADVEFFDADAIDAAFNAASGRKPTLAKAPTAGPNLEGLNSDLAQRLQQAQEAHRQRFGKDLQITSGVRTREEQQRLYDRYKAGEKGIYMPINPADYPKQKTFHSDAVDIATSVPESFLNEFGIHRPLGSKDPVHAVLMPKPAPTKTATPATTTSLDGLGTTIGPEIVFTEKQDDTGGDEFFDADAIDAAFDVAKKEKQVKEGQPGVVTSKVQSLLRSGAGLADTVIGGIQSLPGMAVAETGYAGVRAGEALGLIEPGRAERGRAAVYKQFVEPYQRPFGEAMGVTETPEYKGEITQQLMRLAGETISDYSERIAKTLGIPKADAENMINTGLFAVPGLFKGVRGTKVGQAIEREVGYAGEAVKQAGGKVVGALGEVTPAPVQRAVAGTVEAIAPGTIKPPVKTKTDVTGAPAELPGAELRRNAETLEQQYQADQQAVLQGQAAQPESNLGTARPTTPDAPFTEIKYAETGLPLTEQHARAQTLNRVLGKDHKADLAAIEGKGKERATKYAVSNTDTPMGNFLKDQFVNEQNGLSNYINNKIKETGGTVGLDESSVYKRGNTILQPLKDLQSYFDDATRKIYAERDVIAKDIPVEAQNIMKVLGDESLTLANTETIGLTKIVEARMKQLGMIDKDGNLLSTDAKTAENLRKFINENWDRKNANLHKALKSAVDEDVIANLDTTSSLYKDARALVELRKNTLDNPKGISNILDAEGPKGINRKVQIEKIAQNIADMPVDQFNHVIDTLRNVPEQLRPQAAKAISEIKAQFVNKIAEQKTPAQLTKYMNDNREVMSRLFSEKEINGLRDYHDAKHILSTDTGYKGAAVQKINVEKKLGTKIAEQALHKGGAVVAGGGAEALTLGGTGGVAGSAATMAAYELIGSRLAKKQAKRQAKAEAAALRSEEQRFVPISDLLPQNQPGAGSTLKDISEGKK